MSRESGDVYDIQPEINIFLESLRVLDEKKKEEIGKVHRSLESGNITPEKFFTRK